MPKIKKPVSSKLRSLAEEFRDETFVFECRCCGVRLGSAVEEMRRSTVTQHIGTVKHAKNKSLMVKQRSLTFEKDTFAMDLCQVRFDVLV